MTFNLLKCRRYCVRYLRGIFRNENVLEQMFYYLSHFCYTYKCLHFVGLLLNEVFRKWNAVFYTYIMDVVLSQNKHCAKVITHDDVLVETHKTQNGRNFVTCHRSRYKDEIKKTK